MIMIIIIIMIMIVMMIIVRQGAADALAKLEGAVEVGGRR